MRGIVAWTVIALTLLSLSWTTFKSRRLLGRALGRQLKSGEETSLRSWMEVSEEGLAAATRELDRNPFERIVQFLNRIGLAKDDLGSPPAAR